MRILVVDDNIRNLRLLHDMLEAIGHEVTAAESAQTGLEQARALHYDLIFMDVQMPQMSGIEVMETLKADASWQVTPIIAITAHAMRGDDRNLLKAGFDAYVSKPVSMQELLEVIEAFTVS